ncbi:DUF3151 domain-containing protein [Lysinibacter sp. HNR]|uniref:DUF3151 domain-containing protein n=1 Tax=Lysinibacter sp. HNR TaxID=3031408 RepID=UPI002435C5CD|nr:DUF3151 domain-containing protein [Lysinibacter sp. HNR]WGD37157.1 DUF3151 domain-containing protein [Lysinibacter sp. HNR]
MTLDNLLGIPPTYLPAEDDVLEAIANGTPVAEIARAHPASSLAWARLAEDAHARGETLPAYAYARVAYHRGLDSLRRAGWKGQGPIPWSHEPNRGVLRALYALRRSAAEIGEEPEITRLTEFLNGADPDVIAHLDRGE